MNEILMVGFGGQEDMIKSHERRPGGELDRMVIELAITLSAER